MTIHIPATTPLDPNQDLQEERDTVDAIILTWEEKTK